MTCEQYIYIYIMSVMGFAEVKYCRIVDKTCRLTAK